MKGATKDAPRTVSLRKLPTISAFISPVIGPFTKAELPARLDNGTIKFEEPYTTFTPNMTPSEVLELGSFGGTFFRPIYSRTLGQQVDADYNEFPEDWFHPRPNRNHQLSKPDNITRDNYDTSLNFYGVKAGQSLEDWEKSGWIRAQDPRGWFQWYCRFYLGRRSEDDERQISRCMYVLSKFRAHLLTS